MIDKAIDCFQRANRILEDKGDFDDFRAVIALCALELLIIKKIIHGDNLVRNQDHLDAMKEERITEIFGVTKHHDYWWI